MKKSFFSLLVALALCGCAAEPAAERAAPAPEEEAPAAAEWASLVPEGRTPLDGVLTGGQPTPEQLEAISRAGFRTVINLRLPSEPGVEGEAEKVAELGMRYVSIPVAGAEGLTEDNVRALAEALAAAPGPTLLHCGSGNRVGALLALKAHWLDGASPEEALEEGRAGGLTRLEPAVRELVRAPDRGE